MEKTGSIVMIEPKLHPQFLDKIVNAFLKRELLIKCKSGCKKAKNVQTLKVKYKVCVHT